MYFCVVVNETVPSLVRIRQSLPSRTKEGHGSEKLEPPAVFFHKLVSVLRVLSVFCGLV